MRHILSRSRHLAAAILLVGLASAPAMATMMIGPDVPAEPAPTKQVRLADAETVATGAPSKLSELEAGGMLAASVLFSLMLWRGGRAGGQKD
jgi:hypothetical protein